ncbi:MAG: hypothetical protein AB8G22_12270 [Saprospiraceae bacterium]
MNYSKTYRSKIYRDFQEIQQNSSWHSVTRFYEKNEGRILSLDFEEHFDLMLCYTGALFEIGAYRKHILMANTIIEISITQNIDHWNGDDIYTKTLFRKAASHYNLSEPKKCEHILRELIKMDPQDEDSITFLKRCLRNEQPKYIQYCRATAMFLFFAAALVICVEMLFVKNFMPNYTELTMDIRTGIFAIGLVIFVSGDLYHRWRTNKEANDFVQKQMSVKRDRIDILL